MISAEYEALNFACNWFFVLVLSLVRLSWCTIAIATPRRDHSTSTTSAGWRVARNLLRTGWYDILRERENGYLDGPGVTNAITSSRMWPKCAVLQAS
jgi:hypothetical protein